MVRSHRRLLSRALPAALLLAVLGLAPAPPGVRAAGDSAAAGAELEQIRKQIKAVESRVRRDTARRSQLDRDLRSAEESAARARQALTRLRRDLSAVRAEQDRLKAAQEQARQELDRQRAALEVQLRLAHRSGSGSRIQALLKDGDAGDLGRRLQYLAYLSRSRQEAVAGVQVALDALEESRRQAEAKAAELAALEEKQSAEVAALEGARKERAAVLARVDREVKGRDAELKRLRSQAADLERLIRDLERAIARESARRDSPPQPKVPGDGQALPKGRWPVVGRLLADFGQPRAGGQMRWDGVLIGAPAGTDVRATRGGRVVYADWLPGMGLLMVLDHGQGILSLYGHNQELVRGVGDRVSAGDTIARVGDTGGQGRPALYFEVRRNGKPQNPHRWVQ